MRRKSRLAAALAGLLVPSLGLAHGAQPRIVALSFPPQLGGALWAVTDNQGLYSLADGTTNWLCEDAVARNAGFQQAVPTGQGDTDWLVASSYGLFQTHDRGCNFEAVGAPLEAAPPGGLWADPANPQDVLTVTQWPDTPNDVYWTADGGGTWQASGLAVDGIFHGLVRSPVDSRRVYVAHARGAARSEDGGRTFEAMPMGPPELDAAPEEFRLLLAHPTHAEEIWAVVERFPESIVLRSADAGRTWQPMLTLGDTPAGMAFDADASHALIVSRFDEYRRSADGGETWTRAPETVPILGCLTLEPGTNRLWGCSNVFFMGPWVLGRSDDFGETWTPALSRFTDVRSRWGCPAGSAAETACVGLCPGQPIGATCGGGAPDAATDVDAGPSTPDGGALPAADAVVARPEDVGVTAVAEANAGTGGCSAAATRGTPWAAAAFGVVAGVLGRRRRARV